jgi:hypothetical protein
LPLEDLPAFSASQTAFFKPRPGTTNYDYRGEFDQGEVPTLTTMAGSPRIAALLLGLSRSKTGQQPTNQGM